MHLCYFAVEKWKDGTKWGVEKKPVALWKWNNIATQTKNVTFVHQSMIVVNRGATDTRQQQRQLKERALSTCVGCHCCCCCCWAYPLVIRPQSCSCAWTWLFFLACSMSKDGTEGFFLCSARISVLLLELGWYRYLHIIGSWMWESIWEGTAPGHKLCPFPTPFFSVVNASKCCSFLFPADVTFEINGVCTFIRCCGSWRSLETVPCEGLWVVQSQLYGNHFPHAGKCMLSHHSSSIVTIFEGKVKEIIIWHEVWNWSPQWLEVGNNSRSKAAMRQISIKGTKKRLFLFYHKEDLNIIFLWNCWVST